MHTTKCFQALPGKMGDIEVGPDGRADFRFVNHNVKVWDMIGRSMIMHDAATEMVKQIMPRIPGRYRYVYIEILKCFGVKVTKV